MGKLDQICNFASSSYQNVPLFDALIYIIKLCEEHDFQYLYCVMMSENDAGSHSKILHSKQILARNDRL